MSWVSLDHFVTVKAALATQAAATRFLNVGGKASAADAEDSVEMAGAADMAETAPIVFHLVYEDAAGNVSQRIVTVRKIETGRSGPRLRARMLCPQQVCSSQRDRPLTTVSVPIEHCIRLSPARLHSDVEARKLDVKDLEVSSIGLEVSDRFFGQLDGSWCQLALSVRKQLGSSSARSQVH